MYEPSTSPGISSKVNVTVTSPQLSDAVAMSYSTGSSELHVEAFGHEGELRSRGVLDSDGLRGRRAVARIVVAERTNDHVVARCVAGVVSLDTSIVTSPQLSDAVASSIGISSSTLRCSLRGRTQSRGVLDSDGLVAEVLPSSVAVKVRTIRGAAVSSRFADTSIVTSPQLSDAVASSMGISSSTLRCSRLALVNSETLSWTVMVCVAPKRCFSIVSGREGANDHVVAAASPAMVSLDTSIVTSPQLSDAVASSIGISSRHSTV